ncbi:MAG: hypothetical protein GX201_04265 [Clostridiales bacterium]|nr:hypothetical protein [Clostridiales bacterium]
MNDKSKEQLIDFFPYPIAIFTKQYTLVKVNRAFSTEAKLRFKNQEKSTMRILQYKIKDTQLAVAVVKVFDGNTFFLEGLNNPFSMFSGFSQQIESQLDRFDRAVIFPVSKDNSKITHGVIVFMS